MKEYSPKDFQVIKSDAYYKQKIAKKIVHKKAHWIYQTAKSNLQCLMMMHGKSVSLYRRFWEEKFGPINKGQKLVRSCDEEFCVNPDHFKSVYSPQLEGKLQKKLNKVPKGNKDKFEAEVKELKKELKTITSRRVEVESILERLARLENSSNHLQKNIKTLQDISENILEKLGNVNAAVEGHGDVIVSQDNKLCILTDWLNKSIFKRFFWYPKGN